MKISRPDVSRAAQVERPSSPGEARSATGAEASSQAARPSSEVRVSAVSRELVAPETPDVARVARLRAAIADGTFEVHADQIAERMLDEER